MKPYLADAVILAGGRGTRFWPRSRTRAPKQLINIVGEESMLQQTYRRLRPLFPPSRMWVVTTEELVPAIRKQLPQIPAEQILAEPVGRNTAAAIGLAAFHVHFRRAGRGESLMAVFPADHVISRPEKFRQIVQVALAAAASGPYLVILGIEPTRPETGYGYIERGRLASRIGNTPIYRVKRFTEKPDLRRALRYLRTRRYFWNSGTFFWKVNTFLDHLRRFLPETFAGLSEISASHGGRSSKRALRRLYPRFQSISVDYAIMERARDVLVIPCAARAGIGWSDLGSWAAVYEFLARKPGETISTGPHLDFDATGNFFWAPGKLVAAVGVRDLVMVETEDAILVCPRSRSQDVSKVVRKLEEMRRNELL